MVQNISQSNVRNCTIHKNWLQRVPYTHFQNSVTQKYSRTINDIQNSFTFTRNSRRLRLIRKWKEKKKFTNQYFIFLDQSNATKEDVMSCLICSRIIALRVITFIEPYEDYVQSKLTSKPHQSRSRTIRAFWKQWNISGNSSHKTKWFTNHVWISSSFMGHV